MSAQNSGSERKMPEGTPFKKGQSGNPGGRPKEVKELQALARESCGPAIEYAKALVAKGLKAIEVAKNPELAESGEEFEAAQGFDHRVGMTAAAFIRDTGMGKPAQAVEVSGKDGGPIQTSSKAALSRLTDEQLAQIEAIYIAAGIDGGEGGEGET